MAMKKKRVIHVIDSSGLDSFCGEYKEEDDDETGMCLLQEDLTLVTCPKCAGLIIHKLLINLKLLD